MFEVIEHVAEWQSVLREACRVLAPAGQLVVSTPNKAFYAKTRGQSGPNPYHEHEFEYGEFYSALADVFPQVAIFLEDHTEGVVFRPVGSPVAADVRLQDTESDPEESSFFVAVCGPSLVPATPAFVYVPRSSNILGEKLRHIERLESELKLKDGWIGQLQATHQQLLAAHEGQRAELEKSNRWATETAAELNAARETIAAYKNETLRLERESQELTAAHDAHIASLTAMVEERTKWAQECAADRDRQTRELATCVEALHKTEATLEERTRWALTLDEQRIGLETALASVRASRWIRLGRVIGLGPELQGL
jgi:hypothetical protein